MVDRVKLREQAQALAARGVYIGTSSWKYTGWFGQLYEEDRYLWNGKVSEARFNRHCLSEYAEVFKTVCVDAAYYKFPTTSYLEDMAAQVPGDFLFAFKVTDDITIKKFTNLPRFGPRAGQVNEHFLNADLFASSFLEPCQSIRAKVGLLMFEFSRFYKTDFKRGRDFIEALDQFLTRLPSGWPYGVELRNRYFLHPDYFAMLSRHGVTHIYNSWQLMPSIAEQMAMPGSQTSPERVAARFLLAPGRKYQEAVDRFSPYNEVKEINERARSAGAALIKSGLAQAGKRRAFLYVNNRLEGNALATITAMMEQAAL
jgi:uncharacterized protein YecE (DUF72 family)